MKVLIVDQSPALAAKLAARHQSEQSTTAYETHVFELESNYDHALHRLADPGRYDAVVVDPYPPVENEAKRGAAYIERLANLSCLIVVVTASWRIDECVACMRAGAFDFIQKTRGLDRIVDLVVSAIEESVKKRPPLPDPDVAFVNNNLANLCREYGGLWIAVTERQVVAAADSYAELCEGVRGMPIKPRMWRLPQGWFAEDAD